MHPRVTASDATTVTFADGTTTTPAAIVWATGYRSDCSFIDITGATDTTRGTGPPARGQPRPRPVLPRPALAAHRGSALLGFVGADAAHIATAPAPTPVPAA